MADPFKRKRGSTLDDGQHRKDCVSAVLLTILQKLVSEEDLTAHEEIITNLALLSSQVELNPSEVNLKFGFAKEILRATSTLTDIDVNKKDSCTSGSLPSSSLDSSRTKIENPCKFGCNELITYTDARGMAYRARVKQVRGDTSDFVDGQHKWRYDIVHESITDVNVCDLFWDTNASMKTTAENLRQRLISSQKEGRELVVYYEKQFGGSRPVVIVSVDIVVSSAAVRIMKRDMLEDQLSCLQS